MRYLPILLIIAVLAFGAKLPTSTPAQTTLCGTTPIPELADNEVLHLILNTSDEIIGWTVRLRADFDSDGDVDLDDYAIFAAAFTGPG